jgi:cyclopropane-fatty-acyl-phospholipid synthase
MTSSTLLQPAPDAAIAAPDHPIDVDHQFFSLWLDRTMSQSAAMFQDGDDLHTAQIRAIDYLLAAARCHNTRRALDIDCGWGGTLDRMVTHSNVQRPVGLTLNAAQARWVASHRPARIQLRLECWQEHETLVPYDAIVSIGALERLFRPDWQREQRASIIRRFFEKCRHWLKPGGRMALQTITHGNRRSDRPVLAGALYAIADGAADSDPARVSEIIDATHGLFEIIRLRNDPEHYARTCDAWMSAIEQRRAAAVALVGADVVENHERHLRALRRQFETGRAGLARVVLQAI